MKQKTTIYLLMIISILSLGNAGVIREESEKCIDKNGNPCRKIIDYKEDLVIKNKDIKKRSFFESLFEDGDEDDDWLNNDRINENHWRNNNNNDNVVGDTIHHHPSNPSKILPPSIDSNRPPVNMSSNGNNYPPKNTPSIGNNYPPKNTPSIGYNYPPKSTPSIGNNYPPKNTPSIGNNVPPVNTPSSTVNNIPPKNIPSRDDNSNNGHFRGTPNDTQNTSSSSHSPSSSSLSPSINPSNGTKKNFLGGLLDYFNIFGGDDYDDDFGDDFFGKGNNDDFFGKGNNDDYFGNSNNDDYYGKSNNDDYYGKSNNDDYYGKGSNDNYYGNSNYDDYYGKSNNDDYYGNSNYDDYYGKGHNDDYYGKNNNGGGYSNTSKNNPPSGSNQGGGSSSSSSSIPIKEFSMTGFHKCTSQQTQALQNLIEDIKTYRAAALYVAEHQDEDVNYNKIFLKYFKSNSVLSTVKRIFNDVNNMSVAEAYCEPSTDKTCSDNAIAWTYGDSREFHVCPDFFTDIIMHGTIEDHKSEAASIIVHELTHCFGSEDYAYGENNCDRLDPERASLNADTLKYFAMSSIYYLNDKKNGKSMYKTGEERIDMREVPLRDKVIKRPKNRY
ncbi:hypothetical protein PIROE2DRAFT_64454 [Piromyces sp. E2]|nr:hypothetical protein PIROE2DRAFT_64454 [Piromyces sp. E2]|eukprot:OUM58367.1 hypothetical protein PIROE2DRAFT_64454 [Piromyces sp. E2]